MRYIDEFRDKKKAEKIIEAIHSVKLERKINIMEVCGTHTVAICKYGIRSAMPKNVNLISGPGCPVCVSPQSYIDKAVMLTQVEDTLITTFGDMMKVPGSLSSLMEERANGKDVRVVYSPFESLKIAKENTSKKVVFLAVGFETTIPSIAVTIISANEMGLKNFYILCGNKLIPPAIDFLLQAGDCKVDGFILPGHVSTVIGLEPYYFIADKYKISCVVSGFEPIDILYSIYLLLTQIQNNKAEVSNQYTRSVKNEGNKEAVKTIYKVFEICDTEWRGIGNIPLSGLKLKENYKNYDADKEIATTTLYSHSNKIGIKDRCICGEILKGLKTPLNCKLFKKICTPESPVGPCMVSSEGTCAAFFNYS